MNDFCFFEDLFFWEKYPYTVISTHMKNRVRRKKVAALAIVVGVLCIMG